MEVKTRKESITRIECDAIINPANSFGYMGGGVAKVIKDVGGEDIEEEAISNAPVEIGTACATTSGDLRCKAIIHTPTMRDPGSKTNTKLIEEATRAALELSDEMGYKKIAMPGLGTGVGGVSQKESAKTMLEVILSFQPENLEEIVLIDIDEEMVDAWNELL